MQKPNTYCLFQYALYPGILIFVTATTILLIDHFKPEQYLYIPLILTGCLLLLFVFGERFVPYREDWYGNRGDLKTDLIQTFITLPFASKLAEFMLPVLMYIPVRWFAGLTGIEDLTEKIGLYPHFIIALLACEFCYYWIHRISHTWPILWRFHVVHHAADRVYWVNSGRFHFIEAFLSTFCYFLPLIFLGANAEVTVLVVVFSAMTGFLEHINMDFKAGILNYVFNTAELHRWHHSKVIKESNMNYGKVLVVWDLIFGTFFWPKLREVEEVGVDGEVVPDSFRGQFMHPFKRKA